MLYLDEKVVIYSENDLEVSVAGGVGVTEGVVFILVRD